MAASGNKKMIESKEYKVVPVKGVPHSLFAGYSPLQNLIAGYSGSNAPGWLSFFVGTTLEGDILLRAYHAAPLEEVETYVRKAHELKEAHLPETLFKATVQAIENCDVNLGDNEGMAERLTALYKDLCCKDSNNKIDEDKFRAFLGRVRNELPPTETKEEQKKREDLNQTAITNLFDTLKKNNKKNTDDAIKTFKEWAKTTSLINRIHLIYLARVELANRGTELEGGYYGDLGDRWCYEVMGDALQKDGLSPRMQQVLAAGVYYIFYNNKVPVRFSDLDASSFMSPPDSNLVLGSSCFYNELGRRACGHAGRLALDGATFLRTYYEQLQQHTIVIAARRPSAQPSSCCRMM